MLEAIIDTFINRTSDLSKALRKEFVLVVIPIINPDGVERGYTRSNTVGENLNAIYHEINPAIHPGPNAVLELALYLSKDNRLYFYVDLHSHSNKDSGFVFSRFLDSFH